MKSLLCFCLILMLAKGADCYHYMYGGRDLHTFDFQLYDSDVSLHFQCPKQDDVIHIANITVDWRNSERLVNVSNATIDYYSPVTEACEGQRWRCFIKDWYPCLSFGCMARYRRLNVTFQCIAAERVYNMSQGNYATPKGDQTEPMYLTTPYFTEEAHKYDNSDRFQSYCEVMPSPGHAIKIELLYMSTDPDAGVNCTAKFLLFNRTTAVRYCRHIPVASETFLQFDINKTVQIDYMIDYEVDTQKGAWFKVYTDPGFTYQIRCGSWKVGDDWWLVFSWPTAEVPPTEGPATDAPKVITTSSGSYLTKSGTSSFATATEVLPPPWTPPNYGGNNFQKSVLPSAAKVAIGVGVSGLVLIVGTILTIYFVSIRRGRTTLQQAVITNIHRHAAGNYQRFDNPSLVPQASYSQPNNLPGVAMWTTPPPNM